MKRKTYGTYIGVKKEPYDMLFHAIFIYEKRDGTKDYGVDRVTKEEAIKIFNSLTA